MKCPKCGVVTFDHLAQCPRCKSSFALQRRLTRVRRGPERPILVPRPRAAGAPAKVDPRPAEAPAPAAASPADTSLRAPIPDPIPEPAPAAVIPGPPQAVTAPPPEPTIPVAPETAISSPGATPGDSPDIPGPPASSPLARPTRPPAREEHAADARRMKERMARAGQVRRQREVDMVAEVDPVLPDWYEPLDGEEDVEKPVRAGGATRR